jgi:GAF domain-containing protein
MTLNERLRHENAERREAENLLKLQRDLTAMLGAKSSLQDSFQCLLEMVGAIPGVDCGGIYLVNPQGGLDLVAHRNLSESFITTCRTIESQSVRAKRVRDGKVFTQTLETLSSDALLEGIRSVLVVPVLHQANVIAALNLGSRSVPAFQPAMSLTIEALSAHIGGIVARLAAGHPAG